MPEKKISQVDLWLDSSESEAVIACLDRRWLTEGPACKALASAVQNRTGSAHVTFAPNGTLGLFLALLALDLPKGSDVLVPSFTFYGSVTPIIFAGLTPVFVDVDPRSLSATCADFKRALTPNTRAVMPVHMYGNCGDIDEIATWAARHDLKVIEDAAQAMGATYKGKALGTFGDISIISLFSDKVITAGEGAVVLCRDETIFEQLLLTRNQGRRHSGTFEHTSLGMNFRITDMQAAVAGAQLEKIDTIIEDRRAKWAHYQNRLGGLDDLEFMTATTDCGMVPFRFPVLSEKREALSDCLEQNNIETRRMFMPMHQQPKLVGYANGSLAVSEKLYRTGLCLPIHKQLTMSDIDRVCDVIVDFHEGKK